MVEYTLFFKKKKDDLRCNNPVPIYFLGTLLLSLYIWVCILPCLQTQGTVTAVQLQTEAPVVTASGQQVQTLQVVVSPPPCVSVVTVSQPTGLHAIVRAVCIFIFPGPICAVWFIISLPSMSCNCTFLSTVFSVSASGFCFCSHGCLNWVVLVSCY